MDYRLGLVGGALVIGSAGGTVFWLLSCALAARRRAVIGFLLCVGGATGTCGGCVNAPPSVDAPQTGLPAPPAYKGITNSTGETERHAMTLASADYEKYLNARKELLRSSSSVAPPPRDPSPPPRSPVPYWWWPGCLVAFLFGVVLSVLELIETCNDEPIDT